MNCELVEGELRRDCARIRSCDESFLEAVHGKANRETYAYPTSAKLAFQNWISQLSGAVTDRRDLMWPDKTLT